MRTFTGALIEVLLPVLRYRFRWVFCQLEVLRHCIPASIRQTLKQLPKSLDDTYLRVLRQIPRANQAHAQRMLQCLVVAVRPLRVEELAELLAFEFDAPQGGIPKYHPALRLDDQTHAVLSTCSSLVSIIDEGRRVQFSHFSVKEFLVSNRIVSLLGDISGYHIRLESAHTTLTQACLALLLHLDDRITKDSTKQSPLANYAAEHWVEHAQFDNVASCVKDGMETLFDPDKPHFEAWVCIYNIDTGFQDILEGPSPLYYAVLCGFYDLVEHLAIKHPHFVDAFGGQYQFPLLGALGQGDVKVAELLLRHGADIDAREPTGKTILLMAISSLHYNANISNIVDFLLRHGADVNAQDDTFTSSLHLAEEYDVQDIVSILLKYRANVNSEDNHGETPLHRLLGGRRSRSHDDPNSVQLLLKHGAAVNRRDQNNQTPFLLSITLGQFRAARILLEYGADPIVENNNRKSPWHLLSESWIYDEDEVLDHAQFLLKLGVEVNRWDKNNETPLHLVIRRNQPKLAEFLLEHGADVNAENNQGMTPLCVLPTSWIFDEGAILDLALLLLKHGAKVNGRDKANQTPLHLSIRNNQFSLAGILLEHAADANVENNQGMTPLHTLAESDTKDERNILNIMQLLLNNGAELNIRDTDNETPLHLAIRWDQFMLAGTLLENGADSNAENNKGRTPFHILSRSDIMDEGNILNLILLLLNHGANVNKRDRDNQTPLHLAIHCDRFMLARILLEHGADGNAGNNEGMTPLHILSERDTNDECDILNLAQVLLDNGAKVNSRDKDDETPLHLAIRWGWFKLAVVLLEHGADAGAENNNGKTPLHMLSESSGHADFVYHARSFLEHAVRGNRQDEDETLSLLGIGEGMYNFTESTIEPNADMGSDMGYISAQQVPRGDCGSWEHGLDFAPQSLERGIDLNMQEDNQMTQTYLQLNLGPFQIAVLLLYYGANHNIGGEAPIYQEIKGEYYI